MLHILRNIFLSFCCFITVSSFSQEPGTKIYTLPGNYPEQPRINTIQQIKQGYILIGTTKGLYKFDGIDFSEFSKASDVPDNITAICELSDNNILIGFNNGYLGKLCNDYISLLSFEEGFPKAAITKILGDKKGTIWIATAGEGLYYLKKEKLYNINKDDSLSDNFVYDISSGPSNNIVAATDHGINFCSANEKKKVLQTFTSLNGLSDNIVRCLFTEKDQLIWFGMQDGGINSCKNNVKINSTLMEPLPWKYGQVNGIIKSGSHIFAATEDNGLLVFSHNKDYNTITFEHNNVELRKISSLLLDQEGNIWAAGNNQLMRTAGPQLQSVYTFKSASYEDLHTLLYALNGDLWFNKKQKLIHLSKLTNGEWREQEFTIKSISPQSDITSLYQDEKGNIWIGTMGNGLIILDPSSGRYRTILEEPLLQNGSILSISGKNNTIWITSLEGVFLFNESDVDNGVNQRFKSTNYADNSSLGSKYVYDIYVDSRNRVWFATDGKGVIMLENNRFTHYNGQNGLQGEVVYKIEEDSEGKLWFSTRNSGLIQFDSKKFTKYGLAEGLTDFNITSLAVFDGHLLVAHKNGIDIINTGNGNISYLTSEQGLSNINTDLNTLTKDDKGDIYFVNEYTIYKYSTSFPLKQKPALVIDKVQLFLKDTLVQSGHAFTANQNNISFYYTGLYYSQPDKIKYQYKLDGYDKDWVNTKDRVKNFPKLSPGNYTFRVRASLNQSFSATAETSFSFTIKQPFWQQWWFILLTAVIVTSVLFFIIKKREKAIENFNRLERERIHSQLETLRNQINPHFLFNSFNTLISEIEENPEKAVIYVDHLSDFYRNIVVHKEKDFISLEEEINILNDYCFIQQKRYGQALKVNMDISKNKQKTYHIVPLALQLLVENAIKHNVIIVENPLHIDLFIDNKEHLIIRNNISKKIQPEKGSSMGLQNIQKRYYLLCKKTVLVEQDENFFIVKIPLIKQ